MPTLRLEKESFAALLMDPKFLPVCFTFFVITRLVVILFLPAADPFSDAEWYLNRAVTLAEHGTYSERGIPTAFWPVGYPAFLGLIFKVTGTSLLAARVANVVLAAGSFWLLYVVVRQFLQDELTARAAVLLLAIYPNNAAYVPLLLTETLYTFLLLLSSFALLSGRDWRHMLGAGGVFGLMVLVKTQTLLFIPVLAFLSYLEHWSGRNAVGAAARAVVVSGIALVVVLPWSMRNYLTFGSFVLVSTNGGMALLAGNNPSMVGDYRHDFADGDPLMEQVHFSVEDQIGADRRAKALAVTWITENPLPFVGLFPKKLFRLWAPDGEAEWGYQDTRFYDEHRIWFRIARASNQIFYVLSLLLSAAAVGRLIHSRAAPPAYYGVAIVVVFSLISLLFSGQSRYHFPAMPFILAYAAWFLFGPRTASFRQS